MLNIKKLKYSAAAFVVLSGAAICAPANADTVFPDDVIVQFSLCVGNDCVNGENFGFDTIRMKENNTRLHFDDTSSSASFPNNDWRIVANDSTNGGANYLAIEDATAGRIPFRVEAGAPANALYVESDGDIGIKTANPVVDLHIVEGNTPTIRLEQDGSDGFTPQTYDVASNEANFFIRDVTNGSRLFFRAKPNAPEDSIYIDADGDIGLGLDNPSVPLHVQRTNGTAALLVKDTSTSGGNITMLLLENAGGRPRIQLTGSGNPGQTGDWSLSGGNTFVLQDRTNSDNEMVIDKSGNMTILGALTQNSDRNNKTNIVPVDSGDILHKVASLPLSSWTYKNDADLGIRHIGPMAQDFYSAFGTGQNEHGISTIDTAGVALAAIQALEAENNDLRQRIEMLEKHISSE